MRRSAVAPRRVTPRRLMAVVAVSAALAAAPFGSPFALGATPTGSFLNPSTSDSNGPGTYVSDTSDGTSAAYHFVLETASDAGVSIVGVEIQVEAPGSSAWTSAGNASPIGTTGTWELEWPQSSSGPTSGDGAVRAVLHGSDGSTQYVPSESGRAVHFDTSRPTAEMSVPTGGGPLAFTGGSATISGTASPDATSVNAFYTTSAPATDPVWAACGQTSSFTAGPNGGQSFSVSCDLSGSAEGQVTGVAVLPYSGLLPFLQTQGAGDAERVIQQQGSPPPPPPRPSPGPSKLTLLPKGIRRVVDTQQTLWAHVQDGAGHPVSAARVRFTASGANHVSGWATTGPAGNATFRYEGRHLGTDTVVARAGSLVDRSTMTWTRALTSLSIEKRPSSATAPGRAVTAYGTLSSSTESCIGGKTILLKTSGGRVVLRTRTKSGGAYAFSGRPRRSVTVYVLFRGTTRCLASRSEGLHVVVR